MVCVYGMGQQLLEDKPRPSVIPVGRSQETLELESGWQEVSSSPIDTSLILRLQKQYKERGNSVEGEIEYNRSCRLNRPIDERDTRRVMRVLDELIEHKKIYLLPLRVTRYKKFKQYEQEHSGTMPFLVRWLQYSAQHWHMRPHFNNLLSSATSIGKKEESAMRVVIEFFYVIDEFGCLIEKS